MALSINMGAGALSEPFTGSKIPRSILVFAFGVLTFSGALVLLYFFLPDVIPYHQSITCTTGLGIRRCDFGPAPLVVYSIVFLLSILGLGVAFYGFFGRQYLLTVTFIPGFLSIVYGLWARVSF